MKFPKAWGSSKKHKAFHERGGGGGGGMDTFWNNTYYYIILSVSTDHFKTVGAMTKLCPSIQLSLQELHAQACMIV